MQCLKKKWILLILLIELAVISAVFLKNEKLLEEAQVIRINEVCSFNVRSISDEIHDGSDYIELCNQSDSTVSLKGWYLSDDEDDPKRYQLPDYEIEPDSYLLLYANGREEEYCIPFKLKNEGEMLFLSDPEGILIDSVSFPQMEADVSYARAEEGQDLWELREPTPGADNSEGAAVAETVLEAPVFSAAGGFYEEAFYLTLEAGEGETIYYTLDGSVPDAESEEYTEPLYIRDISKEPNRYVSQRRIVKDWKDYEPITEPVDKGTVVRAMAVNQDGQISKTVTETYFVNLSEYREMPVISLVMDPEELFGEQGIFATGPEYDEWYENGKVGDAPAANFQKRGIAWEVVSDLQWFDQGELLMDQTVGVRAQGNSGRLQALKRLSLFAREEYSGSDYFAEELLGKEQVHSLMINEFKSNMAFPYLVEDRDVGIQQSMLQPAAVFINGEYWYTRYVMEKYNKHYLAGTYGVNPDNVIIFKNNEIHTGLPEYEDLIREIQKTASDPELTPDEKYDLLSEVIDIQSFIDFFSINIYLCNMNMNEEENYVLWRTIEPEDNPYGDTKWRWLIYDVECVESLRKEFYAAQARAEINSFTHPMEWTFSIMNENTIFKGLKKSEQFRRRFVTSFLDIANVNFEPDTVGELLELYGEDLSWMESFFLKRFDFIVEDMEEEMDLDGSLETVTIKVNDPSGGKVLLNTAQPDLSKGSFAGRYYTDYPVTVTAVAEEGYYFAGWKGTYESEEECLEARVLEGGILLQAMFYKE